MFRKQLTEKLPRFVAIEVDGTKMFYPTCFIGVLPQELSDLGNKFDQRGLMSDDLDLNDSLVGFSQDSQIDLLEIRRQKGLVAKKKETFGKHFIVQKCLKTASSARDIETFS